MNYDIEIQRSNVTVSEFFRYIKKQCNKKGIDFYLDRDEFEHPRNEYSIRYRVIDGKKVGHSSEYRTSTDLRRKMASYQIPGGFTRYYYTDEFEEFEETKLVSFDWTGNVEDAPCVSEIVSVFAYDMQTYILNFDGSCYNEICEFTFYEDKRGYGYYYQVGKDAEVNEAIC